MDVWALNLKGTGGVPFIRAARKYVKGGWTILDGEDARGGGIFVGGLVRRQRGSSSLPTYRSLVVTASGGEKRNSRDDYSSYGKNDPSIPEEDGLEVTAPQSDDKSKTNDYFRKPHFTLSNWRDVRANLVAKEQVFEANMFFEGYSGWEFDQLIDELESKYWVVASCSSHLIHEVSETSANLWEEVLQLMGGRYSELSRKLKQDDA